MSFRPCVHPNVRLSVNHVKGEMWFSRPLFKIEVSVFLCIFHWYMCIYSTDILYVSLSVRLKRQKCKKIWFSPSLIKLDSWIFLWKFISYMIFSINILNVGLSVRLPRQYCKNIKKSFIKSKELRYLWILSSLFSFNYCVTKGSSLFHVSVEAYKLIIVIVMRKSRYSS